MTLTFIAPEVLNPALADHIAARRDFCQKLLAMNAMEAARLLHNLKEQCLSEGSRHTRDRLYELINFISAYGECVFPGWGTAIASIEREAAETINL